MSRHWVLVAPIARMDMQILLTGVSCVGKSTTDRKLAELLGVSFFDLDEEIEAFVGDSIERLQSRFVTIRGYREEAPKALVHLLAPSADLDCAIALPPSGLMGGYLRAIKRAKGIVIAISDKPENILERITFYDVDSKPDAKVLTREEKRWYLKDIRKDITYFGKAYRRANMIRLSEIAGWRDGIPALPLKFGAINGLTQGHHEGLGTMRKRPSPRSVRSSANWWRKWNWR